MIQMRRPLAIDRDDIDRLLIVAGLVLQWFLLGGFALIPALFAGYALWRNAAWARIPLAITALVVPAGLFVLADAGPSVIPAFAVALLAGSAVALGAVRARIGPPDAGRALTPTRPHDEPDDHGAPPDPWTDPADDPALLRFLDRAGHLDRETLRTLDAAWRAVAPAARDRAWRHVRAALARTGREPVLEAARRDIELWGRSAGGSPWTWQFGTMTDVDRSNLRRAAMPALLDAAAAIVLRDVLDGADREALRGPWDAALAEPATEELGEPVG